MLGSDGPAPRKRLSSLRLRSPCWGSIECKELIKKLVNYEFLYKWSVSGTVDFSISEIEAKNEEDAETQARDMCYEGFYNDDCEVDGVNAENIEQQFTA